ncbi:hypothetical protein ACP4OV_016870 [Aristida adscensionis]
MMHHGGCACPADPGVAGAVVLLTASRADITEAALLACHALYSNCRSSSYTCTTILAALLRSRCLDDFLALHCFVLHAVSCLPPLDVCCTSPCSLQAESPR